MPQLDSPNFPYPDNNIPPVPGTPRDALLQLYSWVLETVSVHNEFVATMDADGNVVGQTPRYLPEGRASVALTHAHWRLVEQAMREALWHSEPLGHAEQAPTPRMWTAQPPEATPAPCAPTYTLNKSLQSQLARNALAAMEPLYHPPVDPESAAIDAELDKFAADAERDARATEPTPTPTVTPDAAPPKRLRFLRKGEYDLANISLIGYDPITGRSYHQCHAEWEAWMEETKALEPRLRWWRPLLRWQYNLRCAQLEQRLGMRG